MDHHGRVKLSDFGVMTEFRDGMKSLSKTFTGTLAFMSPERITSGCGIGDETYSYPADVWGVGLSILILSLGWNPLTGIKNVWDVLAFQDGERMPSLRNTPVYEDDNISGATAPEGGDWTKTAQSDSDRNKGSERIDEKPRKRVIFTARLCDFVESCLRRDQKDRLTADQLLRLDFITHHQQQFQSQRENAANENFQVADVVSEENGAEPLGLFEVSATSESIVRRMCMSLVRHMSSDDDIVGLNTS